ncbi:MAG TPA: galactose oxidase-like domain-containing protein [Candidatus Polarisedimenticolaceae bacterium]|nr:galactose oxidase-like domain-containing protein [Candidatus Polarisedimenticolaceae bacterium]
MRRLGICAAMTVALAAGAGARAQCGGNVPHVTGTWTILPYQMPINPIAATLLRSGKVLVIAGSENDASNNSTGSESYRALLWDPTALDATGIVVQNLEYDVFCSGTAQLPHGRTLTVGGTSDYSFKGDKRASFFDPATGEFNQSQDMAGGRWYGSATALGDGRIMAFSGLGQGGSTNTTVQIYDLTNAGAGWGSTVTDPFTPPLFPRNFLLPSGKTFFTGHGSGGSISNGWFFDPSARTWTISVATTRDRQYGSAVLLPLWPPSYTPKVMNFGGGNPASRSTEIIDLSAASPSWTAGPNMSTGRIEMNAILLPNGQVLASGGSVNNEAPDTPGKTADLYNSVSGAMTSGGTASYSRLYHSTAVLLPDATVASLGSNPGDRGKYLATVEIYTPPYLYDANDHLITSGRPQITGVSPSVLGYGASFTVDYTAASPISSAVLVRPGSTTHAFDMDQRVVGLCGPSPQPACSGSGTLSLTTPSSSNVAPPGYYMLFLLDGAGVPSVARWVELTRYATPSPSGIISSPASDTTINAGQSVAFGTTTTASKYSWIFPGGTPATSTAKTPGNVTFSNAGEYEVSMTVLDASNNSDPSPPTRMIKVLPASADFDIAVSPASQTVVPGQSASFTVTVTPLSGFAGTVSLAVGTETGLPAGVSSGGFSPLTIAASGTSVLTMSTTTAAVPYATSLTISGTSGTLSHTASTTLLVNLAPPDPVSAVPSDGQVTLSWPASTVASSYRVGRSLVAGGPYDAIACPSGTSYFDTGLTSGTTYYYAVAAVYTGGPDAGGASANTAEVSATPPCPAVAAYAGSLEASKSVTGDTVWSWTSGGAAAFDLVRGDLGTLRSSGGDFTAALNALPPGENACLANDTAALAFTDPYGAPPAGAGTFALLRPVTMTCVAHGTYDDTSPSQAASRDAGISASGSACP